MKTTQYNVKITSIELVTSCIQMYKMNRQFEITCEANDINIIG